MCVNEKNATSLVYSRVLVCVATEKVKQNILLSAIYSFYKCNLIIFYISSISISLRRPWQRLTLCPWWLLLFCFSSTCSFHAHTHSASLVVNFLAAFYAEQKHATDIHCECVYAAKSKESFLGQRETRRLALCGQIRRTCRGDWERPECIHHLLSYVHSPPAPETVINFSQTRI